MRSYIRRTFICAAIAMSILLALDIVLLILGKIPAAKLGAYDWANLLLDIVGGSLGTGAMFALYLTVLNLWDGAWEGTGPLAIPKNVRFSLNRILGLAYIGVGASGAIAALVELSNEVVTGLHSGVWRAVPFCQTLESYGSSYCTIKAPSIVVWLFNTPAILWFATIGFLLIRQGMRTLSSEVE